jgi:hypothetical protein
MCLLIFSLKLIPEGSNTNIRALIKSVETLGKLFFREAIQFCPDVLFNDNDSLKVVTSLF